MYIFDHQRGGAIIIGVIGVMADCFRAEQGLPTRASIAIITGIEDGSAAVEHTDAVFIIIGAVNGGGATIYDLGGAVRPLATVVEIDKQIVVSSVVDDIRAFNG